MNDFDTRVVDELHRQSLMQQGVKHYKARQYKEALNYYEEALLLDPNDADAHAGKGNCLRQLGHYEQALTIYKQALDIDSNNISVYIGRGYIFLRLKNYFKASSAYQEALRRDPKNASAYNIKGHVLCAQKQFEQAISAYETAIKLASVENNIAAFYYNKGLVLREIGRHDEALDDFVQALQLDPGNSKYRDAILSCPKSERFEKANHYCDNADALCSQGRYQEALTMCDKALLLDSGHMRARIGRGFALLYCQFYEEALSIFNSHLQTYPNHIQAILSKGQALYNLNCYDEALTAFNEALQLDSQFAPAYIGLGDTYLALNRSMDALKCYGEAIDLRTDDVTCYTCVGSILLDLQFYEAVLQLYEWAFQNIPDLTLSSTAQNNAPALSWYWPYLTACKNIFKQGTTNIAVYLSMRDRLTALGHLGDAAEAQKKALVLVLSKDKEDIDLLWSLICHPETARHPAHIQLELLQRYMMNSPNGYRVREVLQRISNLYSDLFETMNIPNELFQGNLQKLYAILLGLPIAERTQALPLITNNNDLSIAQLLIHLAPFQLSGLSSLAHQITLRWVPTRRDDDLTIRFYHALDAYNVPFEDSDWLFAQELMLEGLYIQAKSVLSDLVKQHPTPDRLWLLATAMWHRQDPVQEQIEVLQQFITSVISSDTLYGEAWERIGNLSLRNKQSVEAILAFQEAARSGYKSLQLDQYRTGNWEAIPGLREHPDYAFPVVVAIDLESDYQPEAAPGSRVFEIAAVRVKGHTELASCNLVIKRDFISAKVAHRQAQAIEPEQAVDDLQKFIGTSIVVGHNLQAFDAPHLRAMGVAIDEDQILDTLIFARLLHPDSIHHHLALLCKQYSIFPQGEWHNAIPDAQACAGLLYALGDELVRRGGQLLAGFRTFVPAGSAFDRAVLQPRSFAAHSTPCYDLDLDPSPTIPYPLSARSQGSASPGILTALAQQTDALIERCDPSGNYVQHLPLKQRSIVVVDSRTRLERMLELSREQLNPFVLPDPHTLLCPLLLRQSIKQAQNWQMKLTLFCLYQASHNHDARTLYPLRLPSDDSALLELRQTLLSSCCASDWKHPDTCPGTLAMEDAIQHHRTLLATHEVFLHLLNKPKADVIIVDDADTLQMHFAEYVAERVTSEQIQAWSPEICTLLDERISWLVKEQVSNPGLYERIPLRNIIPYLVQTPEEGGETFLSMLQKNGPIGEAIAATLEKFCHQALQEETASGELRAYWLELRMVRQQNDGAWSVEQWSFCSIDRNLRQVFREFFWEPYKQHLICGTALTLGALKITFIIRFFGLPENIKFLVDERPASQVYIPTDDVIRPASFLGQRPWAQSIGTFLYHLVTTHKSSMLISLHRSPIANALAQAFKHYQDQTHRQVLSLQLGWTTAKMAERLADETRSTMAFVPSRIRRTALVGPVDIEATGPLRFLNQQDPLIAAHLHLYAQLYPNENPFSSYLLPQALLELKMRISSPARIHIILDSSLHTKVYRDEVRKLFQQDTLLEMLPEIAGKELVAPDSFSTVLDTSLEQWGLSSRTSIDDGTLHLALQTYWGTESFRETPLNQKVLVQALLQSEGEDQLVITATGGGKSLCFQLPAVLMAQDTIPKVTLVITPLIALMQDQVEALQNKGIFSVITWNSTLSLAQRQNYLEGIKRGWYSIIYAAPEQIYSSALRKALDMREIGLVAIDEAHCVSQWGHNFRTEYIALKDWIETQLCDRRKRRFPIIALTATARNGYRDFKTGDVERGTVQDIIENLDLQLKRADVKITTPERPELEFSVEQITVSCTHCLYSLTISGKLIKCPSCGRWCRIEEEDIQQAKVERLISLLAEHDGQGIRQRWDRPFGQRQRGLIYCAYTKTTGEIVHLLRAHPRLAGLRVAAYHGKMCKEEKEQVYASFIRNDEKGLDIVVATNAFGMGIDVRRLGFVIHFDIPGTLEAYIQEAGRAGRDPEFKQDGESARCILLYHEHDLGKQCYLSKQNRIDEQGIVDVYEALRKRRSQGEREVFVTVDEVKRLTGIKDEEEGKVKTILYYLEHHTRIKGKPLLERGENVQAESLLAFEYSYEERIQSTAIDSSSRQLIDVFRTSDEFRLRERTMRMIDGDELADFLGWERRRLSTEINNLVKRHILVHADHLYVRWLKSRAEALQLIGQLEQDVSKMLLNIPNQQALRNGQRVTVDIEMLYHTKKISAVPLPLFTRFLSALSTSSDSQLQLFEHFERDLSGPYGLRLRSIEQFRNTSKMLFQRLRQVLQRYAPVEQNDAWQVLDMLFGEANYEQRSLLRQQFLLLNKLELISEETLQETDLALQIVFKQGDVPAEQLSIDLSRLRLIERHNERKLELMRAFATMPFEQRMAMLKAYFEGAIPLLEPFKMRTDPTEQQRDIVTISEGFHLVRGPAGSGKTTILKEHVRYLIEHKLVPLDHILVVTHYNGAVERIGNDMEMYQKDGKTVSAKTLNKLGESIFRSHKELLLRPDGQPYYVETTKLRLRGNSEYEEFQLIREALARIWQQDLYVNRSRQSAKTEEDCLKAIQRLRQQGIFPTKAIDNETLCHVLNSNDEDWVNFLYAVYCQYFLLLGENGIYTYEDQILFALTILNEDPEIAKPYQRRYEHIIIDEFQDFTPAQSKLVAILSQKYHNVVAFGDDGQDIRVKKGVDRTGSSLENRFKLISGDRYRLQTLKTNFRSVQEILDLAGALRNDVVQEAARGLHGEKPVVIPVNLTTSSFSGNIDAYAVLRAMVDVALDQVSLLPQIDKGSIALMTAKADQAQIVQNYLKSRQILFHVLGNSRYQSRYIQRVLAYFRLIIDSNQDAEVERLVSSCMAPNFDFIQMRRLKEITQHLVEPLIDTVTDSEILKQINASPEQIAALWQHLEIIYSFVPESLFSDVLQAIAELQDGPLSPESTEEQQYEELDEMLNQFKNATVAQALEDIDSSITYLEEQRAYQQLIVTTIDNAKSQAFDTVFLLGAQALDINFPNHRARLYVSISRARQRFFFLIDEKASETQGEDKSFLSWLRRELGDNLLWL